MKTRKMVEGRFKNVNLPGRDPIMKRFVPMNLFGIAAVLILWGLAVTSVHAQIPFGGISRATSMAMPAALKEAGPAVQPFELTDIQSLELAAPLLAVTTTNLFAQVAFGGGYTTIFSFANTGVDTTTGNLILNDDHGQPLLTAFSSPGSTDSISFTYPLSVPSGGFQEVIAQPIDPKKDPTKTGWARVESSGGSLGGVATFQYTQGGVLSVVVGVLSSPPTSVATIPMDDDHVSQQDTGYAIANPGSTPINIKVIFVHPDGTIHLTLNPPALNALAPGGHVATFLWQDANDPFFLFRGTVVMIEQSGKPFSVVALVLNHGLFTAVPVLPSAAPNIK
jgi:hypothetical protein